jgi:hypothetical protein
MILRAKQSGSERTNLGLKRWRSAVFALARCSALNLCSMKEHEPTEEREHNSSLFHVEPAASWRNGNRWRNGGYRFGCYMGSSNQVGSGAGGPTFEGGGYAFAPDGSLLSGSRPSPSWSSTSIRDWRRNRNPLSLCVSEEPPHPRPPSFHPSRWRLARGGLLLASCAFVGSFQ